MGKRIELTNVYRPKRGRQPSPASVVSVETPAPAKSATKPSKARKSTPRKPATMVAPIAANSAPVGTSAAVDASDLAELRGKLSVALPANEAKQLDVFLERLDRQRKTKAAQMRRYRAKKPKS